MDRRKLLKCAGIGAAGLLVAGDTSKTPASAFQGGKLNAVWVHGTAFQAEDLGALNGILRLGWGTLFRGKAKAFTWFHISIPTPVIIDNVRPKLDKVFVFYKTTGADIRSVHIWDGPRKIQAFDNLSLDGDRSNGIGPTNTWSLAAHPTILVGLGISLGVQFHVGFDSPVPTEILFTTAGADFLL
jgi:hypothetical protein